MMSKYKLFYFDLRDRAEVSRIILAAAGVNYEDVRITFEKWPDWKDKFPLGQVPVLDIDGVAYPQSVAQHRYLASKFGFMGSNDIENLQRDVIVDTCNDLRIPYSRDVILAHEKTKDVDKEEEAKQKLLKDALPKFLAVFNTFLLDYGCGSGYFVGNKLTWADLAVYEILGLPVDLFPDILKKYPKLAENRKLVESNPKIKEYLQTRPAAFG